MSVRKNMTPINPEAGLTADQVEQRKQRGLTNLVTAKSGKSEKQIVFEHCFTYFNLVFIIMAVILALAGSSIKNMTFLVVVVINTGIGIFQQLRAKRAVDKLTLVTAQRVQTLRDGIWTEIRSDLLVQDDVVRFSAGDQICADGVVLDGTVQVNEALLTGEADAVEKCSGRQVLSGSFAVSGTATVQLEHVGDSSFAARLAEEAKKDPQAAKSEMMRALDKLIRVMGIMLIPVGLILFYQEYCVLKLGLEASAEQTVAALVGMIPEGLYLLTSVAMAASAIQLTREKVLVQDMNCIESLARVDVLCVDKTGTITEPVMAVERLIPLNQTDPDYLQNILTALYGAQEPDNDTARALQEKFSGESPWTCSQYIPFDSRYKWCGGTYPGQGSFLVGAPELIMGDAYSCVQTEIEHWSARGYRVLLVGYHGLALEPGQPAPGGVSPLALVLLTNRIRETAPRTFRYFARQGVTVKVISGDNPVTVSEVAGRAGIPGAEKYIDAGALTTDEAVQQAAEGYTVFGRVTPEMKKRLILAMKQQGHTVAMTGDGVNDVLAMKQADCSIAMASGAQAASQVAHLVLTESDFAAMPAIVGEGRRVINNIQRAAALFLVKNVFSLGLALICMLTGWAYPIQPFHMSIIAALTIGVPGFFLAMEPNYERVSGKFLPTVMRRALPGGITNILAVFAAYWMIQAYGLPMTDAATVCTAALAMVGLLVLFQVSRPFDTFRKIIWCAMAAALLGSFLILSTPFELLICDNRSFLVLGMVAVFGPTVFVVINRLFSLWDKLRKTVDI